MRNTIQKQIILETVLNMHMHPDAEEVYDKISLEHPYISKATVYRNLNLLAEQGVIRRVKVSDGPDRYDFNNVKHYHMHCKKCGKIFDAPLEYIENFEDRLGDTHGFEAQEHLIEFIGICPACQLNK